MKAQAAKGGVMLLGMACIVAAVAAIAGQNPRSMEDNKPGERALKTITLNTCAYEVGPGKKDKRSISITAEEDMHIVALEHFTGVGKGSLSDNGHILSICPENPWVKWEKAGTGMEPTGTKGYFGYCGRDYYSECNGIHDVMAYESFPSSTYILVRRGETLYLHCYADNFAPDRPGGFHHMVRVLYW
jgi:hypothetical protein